jgi:hypothetical protein
MAAPVSDFPPPAYEEIYDASSSVAPPMLPPSYGEIVATAASSSRAVPARAPSPPPKPYDYWSSSSGRDFDDGCIGGDCVVTMEDGRLRSVRTIRAGDRVRTNAQHGTGVGVVRCVVISSARSFVTLPGNLVITGMHPVQEVYKNESPWLFPKTHQESKVTRCDPAALPDMYSFLLEESSPPSTGMLINQRWWVAHFAHGNTKDPVLAHPFFGTNRVREDLERIDVGRSGAVRILATVRDNRETVVGYQGISVQHPAVPERGWLEHPIDIEAALRDLERAMLMHPNAGAIAIGRGARATYTELTDPGRPVHVSVLAQEDGSGAAPIAVAGSDEAVALQIAEPPSDSLDAAAPRTAGWCSVQ